MNNFKDTLAKTFNSEAVENNIISFTDSRKEKFAITLVEHQNQIKKQYQIITTN